MGVLYRIDRNAVARYCARFVRYRECEQFIAKHGETYPIKNGRGEVVVMKTFPQAKMVNQIATILIHLEREFGMTPSARASITLPKSPSADQNDGKAKFFV